MQRIPKSTRFRRRSGRVTVAMAVGAAVVVVLAGVAIAKTNTLSVAKNGKVTNQQHSTKTESIAVNSKGKAVYLLTGDSKSHPECTSLNGCLNFWFPVTVKSATTKPVLAKGIKGKVGLWHRNGFFQVTLAGHPLYTFVADSSKDQAIGEGIKSFGGTWHVITVSAKSTSKTPAQSPGMSPSQPSPYPMP